MAVKKKIPMRKCVGCGEMKPKKELMRILRTEEGSFVVDAEGKKNGRRVPVQVRGMFPEGGKEQRFGAFL